MILFRPFSCSARSDFMDMVRRNIHHNLRFEVPLVPLIQPRPTYMVQVTNESNQTYFSGPAWEQLGNVYEMAVGDRFIFHFDHQFDTIYFDYKSADDEDEQ